MDQHSNNITLIIKVGEISEKKIAQIQSLGYKLINEETGQMAQFLRSEKNDVLLISQNQITYSNTESDITLLNSKELFDLFKDVRDKLLLDDTYKIKIQLERSYETDSENVFEKSKEHFVNLDKVKNVIAIGYRMIVDNSDFKGDINLEPFFQQPNKYFVSANLISELMDDAQAIEHYEKMIDYISQEVEPFAKSMF